jgi:hypothetical protein
MTEESVPVVKAEDPPKSKNQKRSIIIFAVIVIATLLILSAKPIYNYANDSLNKPIPSEPEVELKPADVELYKFLDIANNKTASVEIWILNLGEKTAKNITVFVRARSDNGTILYQGNVSLTSELLRKNETCSGIYSFKTGKNVHKIFETIEVSWDMGRRSYQKETTL